MSKHTCPIRQTTLERLQHVRTKLFPQFVIVDFASAEIDKAVQKLCRKKRIELPKDLSFDTRD